MTVNCVVAIETSSGKGFAEVSVNSLHQLAVMMPGSVLSYEVLGQNESTSGAPVQDLELFDTLIEVVRDLERQVEADAGQADTL